MKQGIIFDMDGTLWDSTVGVAESWNEILKQEKVDRYKEQKKNRKKIMKQEKCKRYLGYTATVVVIALIIGWAGFSIYKNHEANKPVSYTEVDLSALTDYYSNLQVD